MASGAFTARLYRAYSGGLTPDGPMSNWTDMGVIRGEADGMTIRVPLGVEKPWMGDRLEMLTGPLAGRAVDIQRPSDHSFVVGEADPVGG